MSCISFKEIHKIDGSVLYSFDKELTIPELLEKKFPNIRVFNGANLQQSIWVGRSLEGFLFNYSNLQNSNFSRATLRGVSFAQANLRGVSFKHSVLIGVDFSGSLLEGVSVDGAHFQNCYYNGELINRNGLSDRNVFPKLEENLNDKILRYRNRLSELELKCSKLELELHKIQDVKLPKT